MRKKLIEVSVKPQTEVIAFSFSFSISAYGFTVENNSVFILEDRFVLHLDIFLF